MGAVDNGALTSNINGCITKHTDIMTEHEINSWIGFGRPLTR